MFFSSKRKFSPCSPGVGWSEFFCKKKNVAQGRNSAGQNAREGELAHGAWCIFKMDYVTKMTRRKNND